MLTDSSGKALIIGGALLAILGLLLVFHRRIPIIGKLPGDITINSGRTTVYIPIVTMILISIALTIIVNIVIRLLNR